MIKFHITCDTLVADIEKRMIIFNPPKRVANTENVHDENFYLSIVEKLMRVRI